MPSAKDFLEHLLERLRAERNEENLWTAAYLTGEYVEFLQKIYKEEKCKK
jgi:hypothetical protein